MDFAVHDQLSCGDLPYFDLESEEGADRIWRDVISAMHRTRFTILHIREVIGDLGAWVEDLFYGEQYLVCDVALGSEANSGKGLATRVLRFPDFAMTTGAPLAVPPTMVSLLRNPKDSQSFIVPWRNHSPETLRMLAIQITRAALGHSSAQADPIRH